MKLTASSHRLSVAGFRVGRAREEWRERRGRKKKKRKKRFNDASFCMLFFRPLQRATNEQASTRFRETWLIHYSNHETWITPTSWPSRSSGQFRGLLTISVLSDFFFGKNYLSQFNISPRCLLPFHNFEAVSSSTGSTL